MPLTPDQFRQELSEVKVAFHDGISMFASAERPMSSISCPVPRLA